MNPEDFPLIGTHSTISDEMRPDIVRLQAYHQYMVQASQASARPTEARVYTPTPQTTASTAHTSLRLERLREEGVMLQRRLRVTSNLNPAELINLRKRLSAINIELRGAEAHVTRESNPFLNEILRRDPDPIPLRMLLEANGVMYGSRGLHIEDQYSDYDFAFSYEEHKSLFNALIRLNIPKSDSTSYFSSVPEAGYHTFFQCKALALSGEEVKVDILFLHNDEDLDVIRSSMQDLQSIPQYMLRDKKFRVDAYNKALQHRGWKEFRMPVADGISSIRGRSARIVAEQERIFGEARSAAGRGTSSWL